MEIYSRYKSPFGYSNGNNLVDSYGVDHSGFSLRDELEYQTTRQAREQALKKFFNNRATTRNTAPVFGADRKIIMVLAIQI